MFDFETLFSNLVVVITTYIGLTFPIKFKMWLAEKELDKSQNAIDVILIGNKTINIINIITLILILVIEILYLFPSLLQYDYKPLLNMLRIKYNDIYHFVSLRPHFSYSIVFITILTVYYTIDFIKGANVKKGVPIKFYTYIIFIISIILYSITLFVSNFFIAKILVHTIYRYFYMISSTIYVMVSCAITYVFVILFYYFGFDVYDK